MPKDTFHNLPEEKKEKITNAFLREFAIHPYDKASLSSVVKSLGIAKGSVYQYFDDKLDLFTYLIEECSAVKMKYVGQLKRENFNDFWGYFRSLYSEGVKFDLENPLESHFLHSLADNLNSPSVKGLYDEMLTNIIAGFEQMAKHEVELGLFRDDIPIKTIGFILYKNGRAINEQMEVTGHINPKESIKKGKPVYEGKVDQLMETVDNYIKILQRALDKEST
ncbi:TetR/AcrR family transcriptional regulator [Rhodohalobacter sulfatireducens]|uniref:TetR/AcrR family transcriptional regulator n=1 Tax=Rhodohalobacter sulfatireducens TaxID=2911366 RepID=A0ABS9KF48_9BACT|nr:TetR/AcrR family transcriptional regulator [Rhodohalobacter sulfatireducens]MCG2589461.1 TetR/AcrR family transcriptional regulator [Rhodohalobacter sulfatireducens]